MRRLVPAALVAVLLLGACEASPPAADPTPTADPALAQIRSARAALGEPMVALAEAVLALRGAVDTARHEVERGEPMRSALGGIDEAVARVRSAAEDAEEAATSIEAVAPGEGMDVEGGAGVDATPDDALDATAAVTEASGVVVTAAGEARRAATAAEEERAALERLSAADLRLEAAAAEWDTPGSQAQRRTALRELAQELEALAEEIREIEVEPEACPALREHRVEWALLLAERSSRLAEVAASGLGAEYDELRQAFTREPFGESRRAADAGDRDCWLEASQVVEAAEAVAGQVEQLEAALNP